MTTWRRVALTGDTTGANSTKHISERRLLPVLRDIRDHWLRQARSTVTNEAEAEKAVDRIYKLKGWGKPSIVWAPSPFAAYELARGYNGEFRSTRVNELFGKFNEHLYQIGAGLRRLMVREVMGPIRKQANDELWRRMRQHRSFGFFNAHPTQTEWYVRCATHQVHNFLRLNTDPRNDLLAKIAGSAHMMLPYHELAILVARPPKLTFDPQGRLHGEKSPAVKYQDGLDLYCWHGIELPENIIMRPTLINKWHILNENNTERRRAICEAIGWKHVLHLMGGHIIDQDACLGLPRKLYRIEFPDGSGFIHVLHMFNGTIEDGKRREFLEQVPTSIMRCHHAVAWQIGLSPLMYKEVART